MGGVRRAREMKTYPRQADASSAREWFRFTQVAVEVALLASQVARIASVSLAAAAMLVLAAAAGLYGSVPSNLAIAGGLWAVAFQAAALRFVLSSPQSLSRRQMSQLRESSRVSLLGLPGSEFAEALSYVRSAGHVRGSRRACGTCLGHASGVGGEGYSDHLVAELVHLFLEDVALSEEDEETFDALSREWDAPLSSLLASLPALRS